MNQICFALCEYKSGGLYEYSWVSVVKKEQFVLESAVVFVLVFLQK